MPEKAQKKPKKQYSNDELVRAATLLNSLEYIADGGSGFEFNQWDASCLLLIIDDAEYRNAVRRKYAALHGP
jgi:hypothetical protein